MKNNNALAQRESTEKERTHGQTSQISEPSLYWFPVYEGLFEHAPTIRDAVWLFMWLIARTTCEADGQGKVLRGIPIHDDRVARELGFPVKTIRRWRRMLVRGGYIQTLRTPYGFRYTLLKSKKWQNPQKRDLPKLPISHQESAQIGHRELPLRAERVPESGVSKKTTQSRYRDKSVSHDRLDRPTDEFLLLDELPYTSKVGQLFAELKIRKLPRRYEPFVELVEENPRSEDENFVTWGKDILDLCNEEDIEYPKVFLKRVKDAERALRDDEDPFGEMARVKDLSDSRREIEEMEQSREEPKPKTAQDYRGYLDATEKLIQACDPKKISRWALEQKAEYEKKIAELSEPVPKTS